MEKINQTLNFAKDSYELSLKRRENIRTRANIVAVFGFSIISLILSSVLPIEYEKISYWDIIIIVVLFLSFLIYFISYIYILGSKTLKDMDPLESIYEILNIKENSSEMEQLYENMLDYYIDSEINNPNIYSDYFVTTHYISTLYAYKTKEIYKSNKKLSIFFNLLIISIVVVIICLLIIKGGVLNVK